MRRASLPHVGAPLEATASLFAGGTARATAFRMPGQFAVEVRGGREILVDPAPGADLDALAEYVGQPMLAVVLVQRGLLVLHASCVQLGARGIAIAASSGQGKSTAAGALLERGHRLLADDIAVLTAEQRILPGPRRIALWPAAAAALGHDPEALPRCVRRAEKRWHRPAAPDRGAADQRAPVPLRRVYVLEAGALGIEPVTPADALAELVRHTYAIGPIAHTGQHAPHFAQLTELVRAGVVRRLRRPLDLGALPALARLIERDLDGMY